MIVAVSDATRSTLTGSAPSCGAELPATPPPAAWSTVDAPPTSSGKVDRQRYEAELIDPEAATDDARTRPSRPPPRHRRQWLAGARPQTLPAAITPVFVGRGVAAPRAACALVGGAGPGGGLALQIGVNYANDYSDGIRGTDADRVGPLRLVGSGLARPRAVRAAAFVASVSPPSPGWSW